MTLQKSNPKTNIHKVFHIIEGEDDELEAHIHTPEFLAKTFEDNDYLVNKVTMSKISILNDRLTLGTKEVRENDEIWIKIDPDNSVNYFLTLRLLVPFEKKFKFINPPSVILSWDDKMIPIIISQTTKSFVNGKAKALEEIGNFADNSDIVIKPLNGFGGYGIEIDSPKNITKKISSVKSFPIVIEKSYSIGVDIDSRIFWIDGKFVAVLNRISTEDGLCNIHSGGSFELGDLKEIMNIKEIKERLELISIWLKDMNCFIAGVDVINGSYITEVNISNPAAYGEYYLLTKQNLISDFYNF